MESASQASPTSMELAPDDLSTSPESSEDESDKSVRESLGGVEEVGGVGEGMEVLEGVAGV